MHGPAFFAVNAIAEPELFTIQHPGAARANVSGCVVANIATPLFGPISALACVGSLALEFCHNILDGTLSLSFLGSSC